MFTNEKFSYKVITMSTELIKAIIYLFVGVSIFIVSMRIMSSGLKKISGKGLKEGTGRVKIEASLQEDTK